MMQNPDFQNNLHLSPAIRARPNKYTNYHDQNDDKSFDGFERIPDYAYEESSTPGRLRRYPDPYPQPKRTRHQNVYV